MREFYHQRESLPSRLQRVLTSLVGRRTKMWNRMAFVLNGLFHARMRDVIVVASFAERIAAAFSAAVRTGGRWESLPRASQRKISQEMLAEMVGTTRSRVSFFMNRFIKMGFVRYNGTLEVQLTAQR